MRQPNYRRGRGRGNTRRVGGGGRNQTVDSSGPNVKVRGTASQVLEKYLALARDAYTSGDRVMSENYFQHAEHYYRVMTANGAAPERDSGDSGDHGSNGRDPDAVEQGQKKDGDGSASGAQAGAKERKKTHRATPAEPDDMSDTAEDEDAGDDDLTPAGRQN